MATRRAILNLLKTEGPLDSATLAKRLRLSAMAVRQHLYALQNQQLVDFEEQARPFGRPAKIWRLTPAADRFFPDGHASLTVGLIGAMGKAFGADGLSKLVTVRVEEQIADYRKKIPSQVTLQKKLDLLAKLRADEGYMAEVKSQKDGSFLFIENHCPICVAAKACQNLCGGELEVFRSVLGRDVSVERVEHVLAGARRCAYRIHKIK
jgi:predicted ArsR family transcriptional regulator